MPRSGCRRARRADPAVRDNLWCSVDVGGRRAAIVSPYGISSGPRALACHTDPRHRRVRDVRMWRVERWRLGSSGRLNVRGPLSVITYARMASATTPSRPTDAIEPGVVGARVKALREASGLSLRDLSERSGVSAPMLSQVERGETSPTLTVAARIAAGLDLRLSQLLRLDESGSVTVVDRKSVV